MSIPLVVTCSVLGIGAGLVFVHGLDSVGELIAAAKVIKRGLSTGAGMNRHAVGLVFSLAVSITVAWHGQKTSGPAPFHPIAAKSVALTMLVCALFHECWGLMTSALAFRARTTRLGFRDAQLLSMHEYPSVLLLRITVLMCVIYSALIFFYAIMFSGKVKCYHMDPVMDRPVGTARYLEWSVTVPCLMWIVGRLLLDVELEGVLVPVFQTLSYIWLAWAGQVVEQHWLRALIISACFTIYGEATLWTLRWIKRDKPFATLLVVFQNVMFLAYGIVYLVSLAGWIEPETEDVWYTSMDLSVKLCHSAAFAAMHRATEVDLFFSALRNYLDILVGMRALVAAQFDLVINCQVTAMGLSISSSSSMLENQIGKTLAGKPLSDICRNEEDRSRLQRLGETNVRTGSTSSKPWERQEALSSVADLIRIDIVWSSSPTGSMPAEIFIAGSAGQNRVGDIVVIGVKLLQEGGENEPHMQQDQLDDSQDQLADSASACGEMVMPPMQQPQRHELESDSMKPSATSSAGTFNDLPSDEPAEGPPSKFAKPDQAPARRRNGAPDNGVMVHGKILAAKVTEELLNAQSKALADKAALTPPNRRGILPMTLKQVSRIRGLSSRSVRSFDQTSICSGPLSPVAEEQESAEHSAPSEASKESSQKRMEQTQAAPNRSGTLTPHSLPALPAGASASNTHTDLRSNASSGTVHSTHGASGSGAAASVHGSVHESPHDSVHGDTPPLWVDETNDGGTSEAASRITYRTSLGETKDVSATVNVVSGLGKLNAFTFTCASSCSKYQEQVQAENSLWDWQKLVIDQAGLEYQTHLGVGSYARVTKVKYAKDGKCYALKEFNSRTWTVKRRGVPYAVRREVSILSHLASLGHPHLCRLCGLVLEPKIALLFELCDGGTLFALFENDEPFSWKTRCGILRQICEALAHLHENRVVHRDLKDNNVLFLSTVEHDSEAHVKVADVGLARWLGDEDNEVHQSVATKMTPVEHSDWHAPEMACGIYDISVDIFSLGVLLLELVTWEGTLPGPWREMVRGMQKEEPKTDCQVTDMASRCLAEIPRDRPMAEELLVLLSRVTAANVDSFSDRFSERRPPSRRQVSPE